LNPFSPAVDQRKKSIEQKARDKEIRERDSREREEHLSLCFLLPKIMCLLTKRSSFTLHNIDFDLDTKEMPEFMAKIHQSHSLVRNAEAKVRRSLSKRRNNLWISGLKFSESFQKL
jgi:hypothetical protein